MPLRMTMAYETLCHGGICHSGESRMTGPLYIIAITNFKQTFVKIMIWSPAMFGNVSLSLYDIIEGACSDCYKLQFYVGLYSFL